ncbi:MULTISPECIES: protein-L-isoaspartate O-methyltransferase family protein [Rhodobacterales]|jgi:protein-L-isoaspartate(D-aspartate) O-methyltransferase|uniref:protein-L-isoaspartate O-methyltransferase family protein n=1 Tax=Rhodobacterales TaxID=204455 RepID=UPI00237F6A43|nr:protein-L-isoaspartate O-methyltransferase [Phaeobacter gallaeciensis]MEC9313032.1 protein-L-isoaspartate O-methyltransferase [Pseudomonadota bacterium]MDE4099182.1 protein-L-isoaspartate O-methyltransferase [Phaeobacter gallaeciensis]MDE4107952.1 protein-L-isoaspartate O-methyltransferase [Phaeobacter gallaeciensis]MDE4112446.1 protein-L-isoaspartate O-methyltransferase [Phaeobacter gallaeciensis]MDE4116877.1 protein-L-isoaspartate O-methyltransferase [Phaeobacter gallaeciensis]
MTDFAERRRMMVDTQVRPSDVTKYPIIEAMLAVPRESFVPDAQREAAYADQNIDLGDSRVLLEPRTLAKVLDALDIQNDELVLDVACGLGYSTAVAARVAQMVIGVEQDEDMGRDAQDQLAEAGADNAIVHVGALAEGAAEHGPYDVIMIQGGVEDVPSALLEQLRDGGRIAAVFMTGALGEVKIGHKTGGQVSWRFAFNAGAPVLPGFEKVREFAL